MKFNKIESVNIDGWRVNVIANGGKVVRMLPESLARKLKKGDRFIELYNKGDEDDAIFPQAYVFGSGLYLLHTPISEYRISQYAKGFPGITSGKLDRVVYKLALMRALLSQGIAPTLSATNNLRLFLQSRGL